MTVQLPILLWTVITFCLMAWVLNRFLFKPMLAFMDQRQAKIDRAAAKKAEHQRLLAEAGEKLARFREEEEKHRAERIAEELSRAHKDAETLVAVTFRKQNQNIDLYMAELEQESKQIEKIMDESVDALAKAYITTLVS
ncbi:MAG: hypothetical protein IJ480_08825 [Clostridia bacterium]|nr:hypothetical protein [Clostridia bacterium]